MLYRVSPKRMVFVTVVAIGTSLSATAVLSQSDQWNTPYDILFSQPGAKVETFRDAQGADVRRLNLPGNVLVTQKRREGKIVTQTEDNSGLGAVRCNWMILAEIQAALEVCEYPEAGRLSKRVGNALSRINDFISENSVERYSVASIEQHYQTILEGFRSDARRCTEASEILKDVVNYIEGPPEGQFERGIDQLLSVPRLPALEPCL